MTATLSSHGLLKCRIFGDILHNLLESLLLGRQSIRPVAQRCTRVQ